MDNHALREWQQEEISALQEDKHRLEDAVAIQTTEIARLKAHWKERERSLEARISECEDAHEALQKELVETRQLSKDKADRQCEAIQQLQHETTQLRQANEKLLADQTALHDVVAAQRLQLKDRVPQEERQIRPLPDLEHRLEEERAQRMDVEERLEAAQAESRRIWLQLDEISRESGEVPREKKLGSNLADRSSSDQDLFDFAGHHRKAPSVSGFETASHHLGSELGSEMDFDEDTLVEPASKLPKIPDATIVQAGPESSKSSAREGRSWVPAILNVLVLMAAMVVIYRSLQEQSLALQEREMWRNANADSRQATIYLRNADQVGLRLAWLNSDVLRRLAV